MLRVAGRDVTTQRATAGTPSSPQSLKVLWPGEGGHGDGRGEVFEKLAWPREGEACLSPARLAFSMRDPDYLGSNDLLPVLYNS